MTDTDQDQPETRPSAPPPPATEDQEREPSATDAATWRDDEITLASEQSFPASDPPPWTSRA